MLERLEAAGAAAVVLPSLFEEQIELNEFPFELGAPDSPAELEGGSIESNDGLRLYPNMSASRADPDAYLRHIEVAKQAIAIPVIASLNATSRGGWVRFATLVEQAGADALELNIYFIPTEVDTATEEVEDRYVEIVAAVRAVTSIPLAVKLGPFFASLPYFANRLVDAGANGLVLFNRFLEPEFDISEFAVRPHLQLSNPNEIRLPLRWIAILYKQIEASLAATGGIHDATGVVKAILAGADIAMLASVLLLRGPDIVQTLVDELEQWLETHNHETVDQVRGMMSLVNYGEPAAFERANYLEALASYSKTFS